MKNLFLNRTVLIGLILIFISVIPAYQECELNEFSETICETEESSESESESKESFRSGNKYVYTGLIKSPIPFKKIFKRFLGSLSSFNNENLSQNFNSGLFFCIISYIHICPNNLHYTDFYLSNNPLFVNISDLKQLRISKMRC